VIDFAARIGVKLMPWQRWLLIHALELNEALSGYRFRTVLVLVARQNGKTTVKMVLTLWRMYVQNVRLAVGIAQDLSQAREVMNEGLVPMILDSPTLRRRFDPESENPATRVGIWHKVTNDEYFRLDSRWVRGRPAAPYGPRYVVKALNRRAGRGLWQCAELNVDELREQTDFNSWSAVSKIVLAAQDSQIWAMSNAGDQTSVVLSHLRAVGLKGADESMFIAEWSAALDAEIDDLDGWRQGNPALGRVLPLAGLRSAFHGDPANVFRTECLCQFVDALDAAVDMIAWGTLADRAGPSARAGTASLVLESSNDGAHITAVSAVQLPDDGRVRLRMVREWTSTARARRELPELVELLKPKAVGWFPKGPGSVFSAAMGKFKNAVPIRGTAVQEAHMTFADYVEGRQILQPGDATLDLHMARTSRVGTEASWQFDHGPEHTDAAWAAAGALHLALTQPDPPPPKRRRVIVPD
jgi:hypothetical protein